MSEKAVAIIQARMGSTRLPGKTMMDIRGHPVLWHVINRVSKAASIGRLIVATTTGRQDDIIDDFCHGYNIECYRGSSNDVLDRYYRCAKKYGAKDIVRITADCPLHDPDVIDIVAENYLQGGYDYVSNTLEATFPDGYDTEVFSFSVLEEAWHKANLPSEREHVTPYMKKSPGIRKKNVVSVKKYPLYRCSLDHNEDLEFIRAIYDGIGTEIFSIDDVIAYLEKFPRFLQINQHIVINEGYQKSLSEDMAHF
jgi:spore coat polysaccharide biosynthesis protein SpsF